MKKRSREGPFDGEGMDYLQVSITDAALPVIPAEGTAAQLMGLTLKKSMHVLKTPKIIAHPFVFAKVVTSTTGTGGFIAQPIQQGAAGTEV